MEKSFLSFRIQIWFLWNLFNNIWKRNINAIFIYDNMFVKPLVLTLGLLYVANKFYLGRGILDNDPDDKDDNESSWGSSWSLQGQGSSVSQQEAKYVKGGNPAE